MSNEKKCGTCGFCIKKDSSPHCIVKDLYTTVSLTQDCDETDIHGQPWWTEDKEE